MYDRKHGKTFNRLLPEHVVTLALKLREDGTLFPTNVLSTKITCICDCEAKRMIARMDLENFVNTVSIANANRMQFNI